ncbi:asparagine--tRNA ligase [Candidatus Pantoea edessiphila]|uniref:Asparagine--tRNA ligase n=1 Tax=Candidatus Pantoea edessiphila TaxID=2044610 RepID=A0A2P5SYW5_9GAMM|nr:asparagine--tRNA ligase [Candidatus Pantoea edessiphila]MBK4775334.1 asparagine--tRNA ligase [Pantoea sp. Edef]PPI87531.1 asparagine--tRNA ligase [Candidatus Pantoea edessiphila]
MRLVSVSDILYNHVVVNDMITVRGWVRTRRDSKIGCSFISIYDGSCFHSVQAVVNNSLENYKDTITHLTTGCSVIVTGMIISSPGYCQDLEIQVTKLEVVGWVTNSNCYPMAAKSHSMEHLREMAHLRPRTNIIGAITRIRHTIAQALHLFLDNHGFFWIPTPIITSSDAEGAGKMFRVSTLDLDELPYNDQGKIDFNKDFFGKEAFLTVSGQLNAETYASALSKVYTFGPTFRAENSNTARHLAEFWMLEPEYAFASLEDIAKLAELMLKYVFNLVIEKRKDDMEFFAKRIDQNIIKRLEHLLSINFVHINYDDSIDILINSKKSFENSVYWGIDLSSEHERFLVEEYFKIPVIIKNYPKEIKAFYMRLNDDDKTVASMDILVPGIGELIGGSQREERIDILNMRLKESGLNIEDYWWYCDLRRYGTVPHSGFGLGFERLISFITGVQNIRDVVPFPRTPRNVNF